MWKRKSRSGKRAKDEIRTAFFMALPDGSRKNGIMIWRRGSCIMQFPL